MYFFPLQSPEGFMPNKRRRVGEKQQMSDTADYQVVGNKLIFPKADVLFPAVTNAPAERKEAAQKEFDDVIVAQEA